MVKIKNSILTIVFTLYLFSCVSHPILRVKVKSNELLLASESLILDTDTDEKIVLFSNGSTFFGSEDVIYNQSLFEKNDLYNCRYCWGKYRIEDDHLTVYKPLPVGILNLPGSYKIQELKYTIKGNLIESDNVLGKSILAKKEKIFIDPSKCWILVGGE